MPADLAFGIGFILGTVVGICAAALCKMTADVVDTIEKEEGHE